MTSTGTWLNAAVSQEMKRVITATVEHSPGIEGLSVFARHGFRLALADAIDRKLITDPAVEADVREYLDKSSNQIGEPLGTRS